jgi:protein-S-isoprenylcysteine O-methyltransferase Ste14
MAMSGMLICDCLWVAWGAIWLLWAIRNKPTQQRESVSSRLSYTVLTVAAFWAMFSGDVPQGWLRVRLFPASTWTEVLGVVVTAAGLAFSLWARFYLGTNWSGAVTVKVGHQLVRSGPYRWVRHPIYTGLVLAMLGTALERRSVRGIVAVVLLYAGFKIKSKIEERTMIATFGSEYDDYSRGTGGILPKLRF